MCASHFFSAFCVRSLSKLVLHIVRFWHQSNTLGLCPSLMRKNHSQRGQCHLACWSSESDSKRFSFTQFSLIKCSTNTAITANRWISCYNEQLLTAKETEWKSTVLIHVFLKHKIHQPEITAKRVIGTLVHCEMDTHAEWSVHYRVLIYW